MDKPDASYRDRSRSKFDPDYVSTGLSIVALTLSFSLQFTHYGRALLGFSDQAISGATILSVSLVFTGLMFIATYHYIRRLKEYQLTLEEKDAVAGLIRRGEHAITSINRKKQLLNRVDD